MYVYVCIRLSVYARLYLYVSTHVDMYTNIMFFFINKCIIKKITNFIYHIVMLNTETHNLSSNIRF
ncbi:hypothetical protein OrNV_gp055 [Oryctes rhinoceros nudivirus]|uniref:Uncharacterized protein n=1 Tax=Oryctes rhinoceros nudivirus TaxID=92521 RepID=A3QTZ4_9VIRU|nr:hypothetical protein OrNV_gp055 [Oryctes rhinoceros nudivirus]ABF93317.1 unknown [Oryctes rhinoceros nudivirus]ACH96185.1 unknown [Oryctes rhinoceros nudivirus]QHG11292.1 hypothetical protein SI_OrNV_gp055 [Oryctes rhinoceros nudivirus]QKE59526.1 hypothetical protein SI_OrNV_gp055 [Oryctes rhinoceros nudivirus]UBO76473.1 hypothetical protein SI_OrNV_gp055 [Oryctes rhinoceros nudivirus]